MIHRYTLPEQLSTRRSLQFDAQQTVNQQVFTQAFTQWIELHPSRLLPAYAIQSILSMGQELQSYAHARLPKVFYSEAYSASSLEQLNALGLTIPKDFSLDGPLIIQEAIAGESLSEILKLARSRGWPQLPVPVALGILISSALALEPLHTLGFSHGGLSSDSIQIRYLHPEPNSRLAALNQSGGLVLSDWFMGQVFQLSPSAEKYGRGPSADCRALLNIFLECLGGEPSIIDQELGRLPNSSELGSEAELSDLQKAAVQGLPSPFAQWLIQALVSPPANVATLLSQIKKLLSSELNALDSKGLSRWLTRLAPEKAKLWNQLLTQAEAQSLKHLVPLGGILTNHQAFDQAFDPNAQTQVLLPESNSASSADHSSPILSEEKQPQVNKLQTESTPVNPVSNAHQSQKKQKKAERLQHADSGSFLEKVDQRLDDFEARLQAKLSPQSGPKLKLRVAVIWLDTVQSLQDFELTQSITVGSGDQALVHLPNELFGECKTLFTPSASSILVHAHQQQQGWFNTDLKTQRQAWSKASDPQMTMINLGGQGVLHCGDFAIYFKLQMIEQLPPPWVPKLPIPGREASLFWCLALAAGLHLALLIMAYGSKSYTFRETGVVTTSKFVEILTQKIEEQEDLKEDEEEELEELEEVSEVTEETYQPEPNPQPEPPRIREAVRELAKERFGKGKAAVDALADFLSGKSEGGEGKLALGDVSAALGTDANSGLSLGSAFGEAGGSLNLNGSGGSLNTSGGLSGSRSAGKLKAKRVKRKVRGRVKVLRSRARVSGGNLSKAEVLKVIQKNQARISACYERQLMKSPNLSGKLTIAWVIKPNGKVAGVKQVLSSIKDAKLKSCVFGVVKKMRFPKPKGGSVKVKYPFVFQQG